MPIFWSWISLVPPWRLMRPSVYALKGSRLCRKVPVKSIGSWRMASWIH